MTDVSRNVVAILLVLVVVVSGLGTWTVLSSKQEPAPWAKQPTGSNTGKVDVLIERPPRADTSVSLVVAEAGTNG